MNKSLKNVFFFKNKVADFLNLILHIFSEKFKMFICICQKRDYQKNSFIKGKISLLILLLLTRYNWLEVLSSPKYITNFWRLFDKKNTNISILGEITFKDLSFSHKINFLCSSFLQPSYLIVWSLGCKYI